MFQLYERDSPLHRMNPSIKLLAIAACMIVLTRVFDPYVPLISMITTLLMLRLLGQIPLGALLKGLAPFAILAVGFTWLHVAFPRATGAELAILSQVGPITIYRESLATGLGLGLRVVAYAAYGLLFVTTTDPTRFVLSLMQQVRLPPRLGYGLLAAYRFFPLYQSEFRTLREAHQVRGMGEGRGLRKRLDRLRRYAIPLLASAVRRAERVAVAMEARGFTGDSNRVYYTPTPVRASDWSIAALLLVLALLAMGIVHSQGLLGVWDGRLYF